MPKFPWYWQHFLFDYTATKRLFCFTFYTSIVQSDQWMRHSLIPIHNFVYTKFHFHLNIKHYFGVQSTAEDPQQKLDYSWQWVPHNILNICTSTCIDSNLSGRKSCTEFSTTGMHQSPAQKLHNAKRKKQPQYSACRENQKLKTDLHNCITCVSLKAANMGSSISWIQGKKNKNQSFFHFVIKQGPKTKK